MTKQVEECRLECSSLKEKEHLRLNNIKDDDEKVKFYTGFSSFYSINDMLQIFWEMLLPN